MSPGAGGPPVRLTAAERDLLVCLLRMPTAGPLETGPGGPAPMLRRAQQAYAAAAAPLGFRVVHHAAAGPASVLRTDTPVPVRRAVADLPGFLDVQPNLVLRLGPGLAHRATVMFNVHLDTVAGAEPVGFDGHRFRGRGAIDAKGPAVALLAGVRAARALDPRIGTRVGVLIQAVSGEEGGAMGTFGTRPLVERGYHGRLNVFCEPTRLRYLARAGAAATARIRVSGTGAVDDRPAAGHNATVLLGHLAACVAESLGRAEPGGTVCVAGIRTGDRHNRVYGSGELLVNLGYPDQVRGRRLEAALEGAVADGLAAFGVRFAGVPGYARTVADAARVTGIEWLKRGLPTLDGADPWGEALLEQAGVPPWPPTEPAFSCDAIWMAGVAEAYTVVLGPGDLSANHAHAEGEFADLDQLEEFAGVVATLLAGFAATVPPGDAHDH